jgi:DNA adenine methylase
LARRIVGLMPRHLHYVEPYAGGMAVLLAREPDDKRLWLADDGSHRGVSEVANDINGRLMTFWRVLQDVDQFARFLRQVEAIPLSRTAWEAAHGHVCGEDPVATAVSFFVDCRQSLAGRRKGFTGITRNRTPRGMNGNASEWLGAVDGLADVHQRLRRVVIENRPALEVIRREDGPATLFYLDPPYLHETRAATDTYGTFEMSEEDHRELLGILAAVEGGIVLSGYRSSLYDAAASQHGWTRIDFDIANHAAGGQSKRRMTECLWMNYQPDACIDGAEEAYDREMLSRQG